MGMDNGIIAGDTIFLSYKNDDENLRDGFFLLIKINESYIEVKAINGHSIILIPMNRVLKIKKKEIA